MDYIPKLDAIQIRASEYLTGDELQLYQHTIDLAGWDNNDAWDFLDEQAPSRFGRDGTPPKIIEILRDYEASLA